MLVTDLLIAAICFAENAMPSADHIRVLQQAYARQHASAIRAVPPTRPHLPLPRPASTLSESERAELRDAVEQFVREHANKPVLDLRQVRP